MTADHRVDALLQRIAAALGLHVVAPLAGGEFGALLVEDARGRELVLKALLSPDWAPRFARGAEMAGRMRSLEYPAPYHVGTGVQLDASWSLQERLPGSVPGVLTEAHGRRLLELVQTHAGAAGGSNRGQQREALPRERARLAQLNSRDETRPLAAELASVLDSCAKVELLEDGVVHGDFHHRNYLAIGDEITGVFDWEFARPGDWRTDLLTLAFWSALLPEQIPPDVARIIVDRMKQLCPPTVMALLAARMALRQLDFDVREHPERLPAIVTGVETIIAPWWRGVL
jgi:aminoglycoside phosphotransferase (APT) family kinase protein